MSSPLDASNPDWVAMQQASLSLTNPVSPQTAYPGEPFFPGSAPNPSARYGIQNFPLQTDQNAQKAIRKQQRQAQRQAKKKARKHKKELRQATQAMQEADLQAGETEQEKLGYNRSYMMELVGVTAVVLTVLLLVVGVFAVCVLHSMQPAASAALPAVGML